MGAWFSCAPAAIGQRCRVAGLAPRMAWLRAEARIAPVLAHRDRKRRLVEGDGVAGLTPALPSAGFSNAGRSRRPIPQAAPAGPSGCRQVGPGLADRPATGGHRGRPPAPSIQQHQVPLRAGGFQFRDGQGRRALAALAPDDVDRAPAQVFHQAGPDGDVLRSARAGAVRNRPGDARAVGGDVHGRPGWCGARGRSCDALTGVSVRQRSGRCGQPAAPAVRCRTDLRAPGHYNRCVPARTGSLHQHHPPATSTRNTP